MTALAQRNGIISAFGGSMLAAYAYYALVSTQRLPAIASLGQATAVAKPARLVRTTEEIVQELREDGLPVAAIAEVALVERKTVYSWLEGAMARPDRAQRVEDIHSVLREVNLSLGALWRVWGRSLSTGMSLRALLTSKELDRNAISAACAELRPVVELQERRAALRKPTDMGAPNPITSNISIADFA